MSFLKKGKSIIFILLICIFVFLATNGYAQESDPFKLTIGGGPIGSGFFVVMSAYARIMNEKVPAIDASIEGTGGGIDNLYLVQDGQIEIGGGICSGTYMAFRGVEDFEKDGAFSNLRGVSMMYEWPLQIIVMEDSSIETVYDFKGKRVAVGVRGGGGETVSRQFLGSLGITFDDIEPVWVGYAETMDGLKLGDIDAAIFNTGVPTPAVLELQATHSFRVIPFSDEDISKITTDYPYYIPGVMKAGTYETIKEDIPTFFGFPVLYAHKDVPYDIVYKFLKGIWDNFDIMEASHSSQIGLTPQRCYENINPILPLHPGAELYYREIGVIK